MKKVLTVKYMLQAYRFARDIEDMEMLEQHWSALMKHIKGKPKLYKRFIFWRMQKGFRGMTTFRVMRFLVNKKL